MENLDLIVLTVVVVLAFVVFIRSTIKELGQMNHEPYQVEKESGYSRAALFKVLGEMIEDDKLPEKHRTGLKATLKSTMSDMESDGVYFDSKGKKFRDENKPEDKTNQENTAGN